MPQVECPACRRECRVRQESLGRRVVCTHCGQPFLAEQALPGMPVGDPLSYQPAGPSPWQATLGLALLLAAAVVTVWLMAHG